FFQAEDGIRDRNVTGVQTCALPILENLLPANRVYQFPVEEVLAAEVATSSPNYRLQRVLALNALINKEPAVVVASAAGLRRNIISPEYFAQSSLKIKTRGEMEPGKSREQ